MSDKEINAEDWQKKIDSWENLRDDLGDELVDKKIAELQKKSLLAVGRLWLVM